MKGISIIYLTNRNEPKFEWFIDSLMLQIGSKPNVPQWEIIRVDSASDKGIHPIPSYIQGTHKITKDSWWSASGARNTGFIYAKFDYVVFVDDLSVLMPTWLDSVIQAAEENYCVLGTYEKRNSMVVENGLLVQSETIHNGGDSRLRYCHTERNPAPASWFFGCSFGMPKEAALAIGGFDHINDCIGAEDSQFGERIKRTGLPMYLDTRMKTIESDELHFGEGQHFRRESFPCSKERYFDMLERYGISERPERALHLYDAPWFNLDLLKYFPNQTKAFHNTYDLCTLHDRAQQGHIISLADVNPSEKFWWTDVSFVDM